MAYLKNGHEYRATLESDRPEQKRHVGGETYPCGTGNAAQVWVNMPEVRAALHVEPESFYGQPWPRGRMNYTTYTGASFDLYPRILKQYRTTIYSGDVDMCVPSNEDWTVSLASKQNYELAEPWRPWLLSGVPAGYVTSYVVPGGPANFTFITVKGAGHMVPMYQPERAFAFLERWLAGQGYVSAPQRWVAAQVSV